MKIKLRKFEGPLDLLLYLIKSAEVDIYDISISEITAQYLDYLNMMKTLEIETAVDFVVMAAHLIYLKSRMMLPDEFDDDDEEVEDMRQALVEQLLEYQKFKEAGVEFEALEREAANIVKRNPYQMRIDYDVEKIWTDVSLFDLLKTFSKICSFLDEEYIYQVEPETITVAERIEELKKIFDASERMTINELFYQNMKKYEMIVTFLAILEMIKLNYLSAKQDDVFSEIHLFKGNG